MNSPPFTWTVSKSHNALNGCDAWLFQKPVSEIPVRTFGAPGSSDDEEWAKSNDGVDSADVAYTITLQGATADNVAIQNIYVRVLSREVVPQGSKISSTSGCGGAIAVRAFYVDLSDPSLAIEPYMGTTSWPYTISPTDIEEISIESFDDGPYEYSFVYDVDWSRDGHKGTAEIRSPDGKPFTLAPSSSAAYYSEHGKWNEFGRVG